MKQKKSNKFMHLVIFILLLVSKVLYTLSENLCDIEGIKHKLYARNLIVRELLIICVCLFGSLLLVVLLKYRHYIVYYQLISVFLLFCISRTGLYVQSIKSIWIPFINLFVDVEQVLYFLILLCPIAIVDYKGKFCKRMNYNLIIYILLFLTLCVLISKSFKPVLFGGVSIICTLLIVSCQMNSIIYVCTVGILLGAYAYIEHCYSAINYISGVVTRIKYSFIAMQVFPSNNKLLLSCLIYIFALILILYFTKKDNKDIGVFLSCIYWEILSVSQFFSYVWKLPFGYSDVSLIWGMGNIYLPLVVGVYLRTGNDYENV